VAEVHSIESAAVGANLAATGFLRIMVVIGVIGLLVPVGVFVTTATRLSAARREQRLAALRLAGATPRQTALIAAAETVLAGAAALLSLRRVQISPPGTARQGLTRLEQLSNAALLLTLVIAGCSLAVAVAGGLIERRRPFALLRLTGMHRSELNRVVLAEAGLPLIGMTAVSVVLGLGVAAGLLAAIGETTTVTWRPPVPG
jgi:hypothetical protein